MPDPIEILIAMAASAAVAAAFVLALGWPWRTANARRAALGWIVGVAAGFGVGAWLMNVRPDVSLGQDRDRFLLIVLPMFAVAEAIIAWSGSVGWWTWLVRFGVATAAARILLHGTVYLSDPPLGMSTQKWTTAEAFATLGGIGVCVCELQFALAALQRRTGGRSVALALAATCAAAGLTTMLSGYESGGKLGLALAAALTAAAAASLLINGAPAALGGIGVGIGCLASVLVVGRFFGALSTPYMIVIFAAPLLAWRTELPPIDGLRPWVRGIIRVALVALPLSWPIWQASEPYRNPVRGGGGEADPVDIYK